MTCSKFQPFPKDQEKRPDVTHDAKWIEYNLRNRLLFNQNAVQRRIEDTDDDGNQFANGKSMQLFFFLFVGVCVENDHRLDARFFSTISHKFINKMFAFMVFLA